MITHRPPLFDAPLAHVATELTDTCTCPECRSFDTLANKRGWGESEWETAGVARPRSIGPHPRVNSPLPRSGPGFISSVSASQQFGLPETIQALLAIAAAWEHAHPGGPTLNIRDISLQGGGPMSGHKSHRQGIDVDIRPVRNDNKQGPITFRSSAYAQDLTQQLVDLIRVNGIMRVQFIFFNDPAIRGVRRWPNHDDHLHIRFFSPGAAPSAPPSRVYQAFITAVTRRDWQNAFLNLNGLSMFEMLRAIAALHPATLHNLWSQRNTYSGLINLTRIDYARSVVVNRALPPSAPGDLRRTGQVSTAADFLAARFMSVARAVNANALLNISLILQECDTQGVTDKSHIAYILATAHWESHMGKNMIERGGPNYFDKYEVGTKRGKRLGNINPGDGSKYKGRGFVQITGRGNYTRFTQILSARGEAVNLVDNPKQAADPGIAAIVIVHGMRTGAFTGKRLTQFGTDSQYDFFNARTIVNGHDRAETIARIARAYRRAMN